jgi:Leucine-rich repeat (LRR) protein
MTTPVTSTHDRTKDMPPRLRRRFPLSLRGFLAILAILGVASALWTGVNGYRQWMALRGIERVEGVVRSQPAGPKWLRELVGDATMRIFDEVIRVDISRQSASESTMQHIAHLTALEELRLSGREITDSRTMPLAKLTNLRVLELNNTLVSGPGLQYLDGLTKLTFLSLSSTQVTDAGLVHLQGFTSLQTLYLCHTRITDAGLAHLKGLTSLKTLMLYGTQVSDAGAAELQRALPELKISKDQRRRTNAPVFQLLRDRL